MEINSTLLGQALTFFVLFLFTTFYVWPHLLQVIQKRQQQIQEGIEAARLSEEKFKNAKVHADDLLRETHAKIQDMLMLAQQQADDLLRQAHQKALELESGALESAQAEIQKQIHDAMQSIQSDITRVAFLLLHQFLPHVANQQTHQAWTERLMHAGIRKHVEGIQNKYQHPTKPHRSSDLSE